MAESNTTSLPEHPAATTAPTKKPGFDPAESIDPHILAKLDPEWVSMFTELINKNPPPPREKITIPAIRADERLLAPPCYLDTKGYPRTVEKEVVSDDGALIPVRIYYPEESKYGPGPYPVHLNFHGGGFVLGSLACESTLCMSMCDGAGVVVIDVNYRHCPETVWGKCFQDAFSALKWARAESAALNLDPSSVSLGGISAGGTITIIVSHLARDAGIPLKLIMPSVPSTSKGLAYKQLSESPFHSLYEFYRGPVLPWASIRWFGSLSQPQDKLDELHAMWPEWWFEPLAATNWDGLCPAFIRTGECDPLRDEGEAYARKLIEAGVKTTLKRYRGSVHTFMAFAGLKKKEEYDADAIAALKEAHRPA
ncbi:hypothetical protein M406DRAFT_338732 [Cryphonectria parasitica EP155]|uniref:Alpha/beta hydrolase fold-3 domain-containing protein n=1 Tax=Cryphonectria parasitica (strain ATCC 38755 / EP155) TaxID=660469 RepID=A0A9P4Y7W6_CRYP1|nr:uncharacterized protein M406DRAFT_338732 [Cryphonectria parasitica EP155]KAF3768100.1 hypothetical protein M406DRAFT_338732 [Cryphonectria parasitica EP155]